MSERLRNDDDERDSPFPLPKKVHDGDGEGEEDIVPALVLLDGPVTIDEYLTALLRDSDSDSSFFSFYETNDEDVTACATMLSSSVTINGNDETCGSSYSDWSSSVMAGFSFSPGCVVGVVCNPLPVDESGGVSGFDLAGDGVGVGEGDEDEVSLAFLNDVLLVEQQ